MNSPTLVSNEYGEFDTDFDVNVNSEIVNAVLLSLFTDRRVGIDELPANQTDQRGWWADDTQNFYGSKLWLLEREKKIENVIPRAEDFAKEALSWMVTDRIAKRVVVRAEFDGASKLILFVTIQKPSGEELNFKFSNIWTGINGD